MKKLIMLLFIVLFPIMMYAKEYEAPEINLKLDAGDSFMVLTRNNLENNQDLAKLNITKEYMEELMNTNKIYYDIIKNDLSYEILVVVPDTKLKVYNFSNVTDEVLNDMKGELVKKTGATVSDIYKANHNYVIVDYYDSKTGYYIVNYYTVVNASGFNIQLQKKSEITEEEKRELKEIVDSVEIKVLDEYKEESKDIQDKIDNYGKEKNGFDYMRIVYGAIIGAVAGLISYSVNYFIRKKKSSV